MKSIITPPPVLIHTFSQEALGPYHQNSPSNVAYPSANRAMFLPFYVPDTITIQYMFYWHGSASGNFDMGIYNIDGVRLVSKGSTAMAGFGISSLSVTSTQLAAGRYYMAIALDNTTGALQRIAPDLGVCQALGMAAMDSAFPLPATATLASCADAYIPIMGISTRSFF